MLRVENVSKSFGGLTAVAGVSLDLGDNQVAGLVGRNGSGKSTLLHIITGFYKEDSGWVLFQDKPIQDLPHDAISRLGLPRTFQQVRVLPFLSMRENLLAVAPDQQGENILSVFFRPRLIGRQERENRRRADEILQLMKLEHLAERPADELSYGWERLLELGRVLMCRPQLVLLDEPSPGLAPLMVEEIFDRILEMNRRKVSFLLVEQNARKGLSVSHRGYVLEQGMNRLEGTGR
ncbi:ABC transporter ATP-binding protein [Desulfoferrobacter suflitae]|uniref:ABC transporter ATP-binding protein n=1 Tax=Desulfoferrobacter suflitae TaxID=2865782 RepID=UPI002164677F|nr:ATP-binding cassette domain-containing protein [Desulfoferrobacter suflitae]MCK8601967.1 ATP-binding cassette domain-containing protein [Desulfoferrobacter suflitae]